MCKGIQSILKRSFSDGTGIGEDTAVLFLKPHDVQHHHHEVKTRVGAGEQHQPGSEPDNDGRIMVLGTIVRECGLPAEFADWSKVGKGADGWVSYLCLRYVFVPSKESITYADRMNTLHLQYHRSAAPTVGATPTVPGMSAALSPQLMATYAAYSAVFDRTAFSEGSAGLIDVRGLFQNHSPGCNLCQYPPTTPLSCAFFMLRYCWQPKSPSHIPHFSKWVCPHTWPPSPVGDASSTRQTITCICCTRVSGEGGRMEKSDFTLFGISIRILECSLLNAISLVNSAHL